MNGAPLALEPKILSKFKLWGYITLLINWVSCWVEKKNHRNITGVAVEKSRVVHKIAL